MKTTKRTITAIIITAVVLVVGSVLAGDLTPPGAPGSTMKTLEQVEPRIPITQADMPFTIDAPGSYYLTTNLTGVAGSAGITIASDDVTLDLMGFTLRGVAGSREGIDVPDSQYNITIRNGVVREWGRDGVDAYNADNSSLENLKAFTNGWESSSLDGLRIGFNGRVAGCQAEANQDAGIHTANGSTITDSTARNNGGIGISTSSGCTITDTTAYNNDGDGINANDGCTITDVTAAKNGGDGIGAYYNCTVSRCTAEFNTGDGIEVISDCAVLDNTSGGNGSVGDGAGIHARNEGNRIDGNNVTDNDRGIDVDSSGNIIVRNTASGNTLNWDIAAGNACLVIQATTTGAISGDSGGGGLGSTNPNANFTY